MSSTPHIQPPSSPALVGVGWLRRLDRAGPLFVAVLSAALIIGLWTIDGGGLRPYLAAAVLVLAMGVVLSLPRRRVVLDAALADTRPPASSPEPQTYALALELAPNPVLLVSGADVDDIAGRRILFANAEARELLRIDRAGALLVNAVRHPAVLEGIDEALFGGVPRVLSYETGGSQDRSWRVWTKPLPADDRHARLALVIMRDETDVRLNERMRADFLANASHELRTPLASLTGFIETLRGHAREDVAARERFLAIMSRQADRMARLIEDLMSLSRIELNEHIRPGGVCDLSMVVGDVVDALAPQIAAKSLRVRLDLPAPGHAEIVGDRDQILQVAQNLLDNAVKYATSGQEVCVTVSAGFSLEAAGAPPAGDARLLAPNGGRMPLLTPVRNSAERYAVLRVEDRGPGMAREHLPRLTERFYRVEGQRSGERMGTGLGLAIVKHIVNRHRGGFVVESAPDYGAAFSVYLPSSDKALKRLQFDGQPPVDKAFDLEDGPDRGAASHTPRAA